MHPPGGREREGSVAPCWMLRARIASRTLRERAAHGYHAPLPHPARDARASACAERFLGVPREVRERDYCARFIAFEPSALRGPGASCWMRAHLHAPVHVDDVCACACTERGGKGAGGGGREGGREGGSQIYARMPCVHAFPACMSVCLSVCLSYCLFCLSVCLPVCLSVCLSACLSACLPVCLSACLSV